MRYKQTWEQVVWNYAGEMVTIDSDGNLTTKFKMKAETLNEKLQECK